MRNSAQSTFRSALQVSGQQVASLSDAELGDLMDRLLRAQAHRCGSPPSQVRVNTEDRAKDGGCDGWTSRPVTNDAWLGDTDTCWQFKSGAAGTPSRLKGEVLKEYARKTLMEGGRFVVVTSGSTNGKKGEDDRLRILRNEAESAGIPFDRIEVIGSEGLAAWCNQIPSVAAYLGGSPEGILTLRDWSTEEVHQVPWQALESTSHEIQNGHSNLEFDSGPVSHMHIYGPSGVGKTRFALELCRDAPWAEFVVYFRQSSDSRPSQVINSAVADNDVRMIVVADEVQERDLKPMRDAIARAEGRIRLVTIGDCATPDPLRIPAIEIRPLSKEAATNVVMGWYPNMPPEHVHFVVQFAAGYVRLAKLAADAVAQEPSIDVQRLLKRKEIHKFLDDMLGREDRRVLHVVAALNRVGWDGDASVEGQAIAHHFNLDWNCVRAQVHDLDNRLGIVPRAGRFRYISPSPLGIYLAAEAWEIYPDLLRSLPDKLPEESTISAYYSRLRSIASNPEVRKYARQELATFTAVNHFVNLRDVRRWSECSSADPEQAAKSLAHALAESTLDDRLRVHDQARNDIVYTLVRLAWRSKSFRYAVNSLAFLAEAENSTWANNATAEFIGKFTIFLSGTAVPYIDRLTVLDDLLKLGRIALTKIVVRALVRVGDSQAIRLGIEPASDELPENEWSPPSTRHHVDCIMAGIERLIALARNSDSRLGGEFIAAIDTVVGLWRRSSVRARVEELLVTIRSAHSEAREPIRRAISDLLINEKKYMNELAEAEIEALEALHGRFVDASLAARLMQFVGQPDWDCDEQPHLRPLALELVKLPSTLGEMWPWLTSGKAEDAWRFGEALAMEDAEGVLLEHFVELDLNGDDLRLICGYVSEIRKTRGYEWYEGWVYSQFQHAPQRTRLIFEVARTCGPTPTIVGILVQIIQLNAIDATVVGRLGYGRWAETLEAEPIRNILQAMIDHDHKSTAVIILAARVKADPTARELWKEMALALITAPDLIRSPDNRIYHWKELVLLYVDAYAAEISEAIINIKADPLVGTWYANDGKVSLVLNECVARDPEAFWESLRPRLSSPSSDTQFRYGFPKGLVDRCPLDRVLDWIADEPARRAQIIADLTNMDLSSDETLTARVLGAYGGIEVVSAAFLRRYMSGGWTGDESTHWIRRADFLDEIAKRTVVTRVRGWAVNSASSLKNLAEHCREQEEDDGRSEESAPLFL
jgi:hypothetical protein